MFEGQFDKKSIEQARDGELLRQFRWTELVAKLSATRDLREELARSEQGGFSAFGDVRRETGQESKSAINHNGLRHGKSAPLDVQRAASGAVHGDREK